MNEFVNTTGAKIVAAPKKKSKKSKIPSNVPQGNCLFIAPSNSGKTNLIINLLLRNSFKYLEEYKKIYIMSPTIHLDDAWYPMQEYINQEREKRERLWMKLKRKGVHPRRIPENLRPENDQIIVIDEYDDELLGELLKNSSKEKMLVILDDLAESLPKSTKKSNLEKIFIRGRHSNVYCWITSQKYVKVNPTIRLNSPSYVLFNANTNEKRKIAEELATTSVDDFLDMYDYATEEKYNFLYVNQKAQDRYSKNFEVILK